MADDEGADDGAGDAAPDDDAADAPASSSGSSSSAPPPGSVATTSGSEPPKNLPVATPTATPPSSPPAVRAPSGTPAGNSQSGAPGGALEKAYLLFEGKPGEDKENTIPCRFNPESLSLKVGNKWTSQDGLAKATVTNTEFGGREPGTLSFDLWFDSTKQGRAVTELTDKLLAKMETDDSLPGSDPANFKLRPPLVRFCWGSWRSFPSVITGITIVYDYFSASGMALRAKASLTLQQYSFDNAYTMQNPTSGTPEPHRVHRVQRGETLDRISAQYYGDSTRWRTLAVANGIEDPLGLRPGSLITIPRASSG